MKIALLFPTFVAALGGLLFGYDFMVMKSAMQFLIIEFRMTPAMQEWTVRFELIGCIFGALIIGRQGDFYGRRTMLMLLAFLFLISAIGSGVINNFMSFLVLRFIAGVTVGGLSVLSPVYIAEISPPNLRGRLVAAFPLAIVIGIIAALLSEIYFMDTGANNWRFMLIAGAVPALLFFLLLFFIPESLRWLMQKGYEREARFIIRKINPNVDKDQVIQEIKDSIDIDIMARHIYLFKQPYLRVVLMGIVIAMLYQFTGINTIINYAAGISKSDGISTHILHYTMVIIGLTNLVFTIIAMFYIDKIGRKKLLHFGSIGMAICLSLLAIHFITGIQPGYLLVLLLIGFIGFFAGSQGVVFWVVLSEMFPYNIRTRGASLVLFSFWAFNIITLSLFSYIDIHLGIGTAFALCAIVTFCGYFIVRKFLYETNGKSLEEMEIDLMKKTPMVRES
jgi:sugar porter (SP) family MFS transporter